MLTKSSTSPYWMMQLLMMLLMMTHPHKNQAATWRHHQNLVCRKYLVQRVLRHTRKTFICWICLSHVAHSVQAWMLFARKKWGGGGGGAQLGYMGACKLPPPGIGLKKLRSLWLWILFPLILYNYTNCTCSEYLNMGREWEHVVRIRPVKMTVKRK